MIDYIKAIPKAELHIHIEGTLEPEQAFDFANRNGVQLNYSSVEELRSAYKFNNLQAFLDLYHECSKVLHTEQDFFDLTWTYLLKLKDQHCRHVEMFYDSQSHTERGLTFETVTNGISRALKQAEVELDISSKLILCFLRHLSEDAAMTTLDHAVKHKDKIDGIGLASSEMGHPPSKFKNAFDRARNEGWHIVAHAGEEGPKEYIWEAIELLKVERIDHGNRAMEDPALLKLIADKNIPLTLCPISNLELQVIQDLADHPAKEMLDMGIKATIHSDDPAYFKGSLNDNYIRTAQALNLSKGDIFKLAENSITAAFIDEERKMKLLDELEAFRPL